MPGPLEILIILFAGLVCLGVPIAVLVVVLTVARRSKASFPDSPPCSNCGSHVVPQAKFCHQCGSPLQQQQQGP
ncbi:zinc-ribbon domain-containing protein [Planctomycetota bacterium]